MTRHKITHLKAPDTTEPTESYMIPFTTIHPDPEVEKQANKNKQEWDALIDTLKWDMEVLEMKNCIRDNDFTNSKVKGVEEFIEALTNRGNFQDISVKFRKRDVVEVKTVHISGVTNVFVFKEDQLNRVWYMKGDK